MFTEREWAYTGPRGGETNHVNSIFGSLPFGKKKAEEPAPAVPAKDTEVAEVSQRALLGIRMRDFETQG